MKISTSELKQKHGQEVTEEFINEMLEYFRISPHAINEMRKRTSFVNLVEERYVRDNGVAVPDYIKTIKNIKSAIKNYTLAYINTDGSINIALSDYDYFVFEYDETNSYWVLVTFKEKSWHNITIHQKHQMAIDGYDRKYA